MADYKKMEGFSDEEFNSLVNPVNRELINDFLRQSQLSPQTLKQYKSALYIFAKWVHDELGNKDIPKMKVRDGLNYQNYLIDLELSDSAIKFKRSVVSSMFTFIEAFWDDEYPNCRNIFTKAVPTVGNQKKKEKNPLTKKELEKLIKELVKLQEWQKLAYLMFSYSTGCRREEARQLKKEVITYDKFKNAKGEEKNYFVTHEIRCKGAGRTGKIRKLIFGEDAMEALKRWILQREENSKKNNITDNCEHIFATVRNGEYTQVSAETFNEWCKLFSEIVGKPIHPHLIRSTKATISVVEDGIDIKALSILLGHNSVSTTEIYVVKDSEEEIDKLF